jgi:exopolysaccharide biosynthesis polyprenyl glycosylphosphotransferase
MMNDTRRISRASAWIVGALLLVVSYVVLAAALGQWIGSAALVHVAAVTVGLCGSTLMARRWAAGHEVTPRRRQRVIVVGAGPVAEHLAAEAEERGYHILGFVEDLDPDNRLDWPTHVLAPRAALPELAVFLQADQVIVADSPSHVPELIEQLEREGVPAEVYLVPEHFELGMYPPTSQRLGDVPLYRLPRREPGRTYRLSKRCMDLALSVGVLLVSAPFLLLAALAIKLSGPGPVLFRQVRVGRGGKLFEIVKFRTMVEDAEKDGPKLCTGKRDPRLTPVGRFLRMTHLDEVPQLWNVLRGEMSLVGPRPERPIFVKQYEQELPRYSDRHRILPGITGLAQINGYYHSTAREKLRFDLMYLYHGSIWLDLSILARTAMSVFQ